MSAQPKYRPSLTLPMMQRLLNLIERDSCNGVTIDKDIIRILKPMIFKANEGVIQPAFVSSPKVSLEDNLGFGRISGEDTEKSLYDLWRQGIKLSETQIEIAMGYGFNNSLLSDEEMDQYTQMLMKG